MIFYTKVMFGHQLKKRVLQKQSLVEIGIWAHEIYLNCSSEVDGNLLQIMLDLNAMELGPEFAISYETLLKISNDLLLGKEMDLNSEEYR